ncbi:ABC-three component system middle component 7 [Massilia pseudoviolaceinigra]|uniref:ABC-three component system middle component 7 n=1 Tax=Massilia pseudoviolaceinigra TaxID=3057165 RepID=UPI002796BC50|nr:ABC-three component system middle component 7 [Massilia sp. CCM 9206]MDQ1925161.1 hypothetical protein [Massilia sp. CCM 9206]
MITPSKFISFKQSIIGKIYHLHIDRKSIGIRELFVLVGEKFDGLDEFIYALDVLYVLNTIDIDFSKGLITYVD